MGCMVEFIFCSHTVSLGLVSYRRFLFHLYLLLRGPLTGLAVQAVVLAAMNPPSVNDDGPDLRELPDEKIIEILVC